MADDLAAQIVAAAQTAEELAPTKQFLVVSVDDDNPVYVNYKEYEGQSNRGATRSTATIATCSSRSSTQVGALSDSSRQCA